MRIALVGKGGSGKTTLTALLLRTLVAEGKTVLAIDADINQHLGVTLGYSSEIVETVPEVGNALPKLKRLLAGTNPRIRSPETTMVKTTLPGRGSHLIRLQDNDPVIEAFALIRQRTFLLRIGGLTEQEVGIRCFHSKTGGAELILNHLLDMPDEWVLVDMTAGADAFASGLFTRFDLTLLVVEPTLKSVGVYRQYKAYAEGYGMSIKALGNKAVDAADIAFLRTHCKDDLLGCLSTSDWIRRSERGRQDDIAHLETDNRQILQAVVKAALGRPRDWQAYWRWGIHFHHKNALAWANKVVGQDLTEQIDEDFLKILPTSDFSGGTANRSTSKGTYDELPFCQQAP
jgi:CO dehydrogenase maturation factor